MILVDGYNLAFTGGFDDGERRGLDVLRSRLVALIRAWCQIEGERAVVVFDGRGPGAPRSPDRPIEEVEVLFSHRPEEADDVILECVTRRSPTLLVTSDRDLARKARKRLRRLKIEGSVEFVRRARAGLREQPRAEPDLNAATMEVLGIQDAAFDLDEPPSRDDEEALRKVMRKRREMS